MRVFQRKLQLASGRFLLGQISTYELPSTAMQYPLRRLILPQSIPSPVGQEIITEQSERFLVADEMVDYGIGSKQRSYTLVRLTQEGPWSRNIIVVNPITNLEESTVDSPLGDIWFQTRRIGLDEDVLRIPEARYELVTSAAIQVNDLIDEYRVLNVEKRLGVNFAQVK